MKGKAKTKAKGKAKAKGKGKVLRFDPSKHAADAEGADDDEIAKAPKALSLKAQVLKQLELSTVDEVMEERRKVGAQLEEQIEQRSKVEAEAAQTEAEARAYFAEVQEEVVMAEQKELEAVTNYKSYDSNRGGQAKAKEAARKDLIDATRALAMIEVMGENRKKVQELEQKRRAAQDAAEAAKRRLADQKAREREALEATRKALMDQKIKMLAQKEEAMKRLQTPAPVADAEAEETQAPTADIATVRENDDLD